MFDAQHSTFNAQRSTFNVQHSTFNQLHLQYRKSFSLFFISVCICLVRFAVSPLSPSLLAPLLPPLSALPLFAHKYPMRAEFCLLVYFYLFFKVLPVINDKNIVAVCNDTCVGVCGKNVCGTPCSCGDMNEYCYSFECGMYAKQNLEIEKKNMLRKPVSKGRQHI